MRRKQNRSEPRQCQKITEQGLLGYPGAREAFERLTQQAGVDGNELLQVLCEIPSASPDKQPLVRGMTGRSLGALPNRILACAAEIERVNSSMFLDPKHLPRIAPVVSDAHGSFPKALNLTPEQAEHRAENFQRLPGVLRLYADYLRQWLPSFKYLGRHGFRPQTLLILKLIKLVRDSCGHPYHREVATLLDAAFAAAGNSKRIGASDLGKLEKNNILLWALLHPELFSSSSGKD